MAPLWGTGFELQSTAVGMEWRTSTNGSPAIETSEPITGAASLRLNNSSVAENIQQIVASAQGVRYYQIFFKLKAASTTNGLSWFSINNGANRKVEFRIRNAAANNKLQLFNAEDATQIGSDSGDIALDTIYILELKIDSTTLSACVVEAKLYTQADYGTTLWNPSGTANLTADPNRWAIGTPSSDATLDIIVDNALCNDNSGSFMNSWCGGQELNIMRPDGASSAAWSRGGTDSGANWSQTDEVTPNDATDYVESNTSGQVDKYTLSATPSSLESTDVIAGIWVGTRFAISATTGSDPELAAGVELSGNSDVTGSLSGAGATTYTSYQTGNDGRIPILPNDSNFQVPGTSSAYTKSDLDSLLVRIEETATDTHFMRVSAVWVYVAHKPGSIVLVVQDATHSHAADTVALTQHNALVVGDAAHGHAADNVSLTQHHIISVADAAHGHTSDNVSLTQHHVLGVDDALHDHTAENVSLTQHHVLGVDDTLHNHTADGVPLTQHGSLVVSDALHDHLADNVTLTPHSPGGTSLIVQDASHAHSADSVTLTQHHVLAVNDSDHSHKTFPIILVQHHVLLVNDALHGMSSDQVRFPFGPGFGEPIPASDRRIIRSSTRGNIKSSGRSTTHG